MSRDRLFGLLLVAGLPVAAACWYVLPGGIAGLVMYVYYAAVVLWYAVRCPA